MNQNEKIVKKLLEKHFDKVIRPEKGSYQYKDEVEHFDLGEKLSEEMGYVRTQSLEHFIQPGVPDFIAFNVNKQSIRDVSITKYSFIEVKSKGDSLRMSQLKWFNRFPHLNTQILLHEPEKSRLKDFEVPAVKMITKKETENHYKDYRTFMSK